jgi:hypothetical protein
MIRRLTSCLVLVGLAACEDSRACTLVAYVDGFTLVLADDQWRPADYQIDVEYTDPLGSYGFRCNVPIPAYADDGAIDGGVTTVSDAAVSDAAVDVPGSFSCQPLIPTGRRATAQAGQELVLRFEGTPESASVTVRAGSNVVLQQQVSLSYDIDEPNGAGCGDRKSATARLSLPGTPP